MQHENYQNVRRKNGGIITRGKATQEQLKGAHDEQEQAKTSYLKAQKEALRRNSAAQEEALMVLPRAFTGAYSVFAQASGAAGALVDDMGAYDKEFSGEIKSYESVSLELGSQQAFTGAVAELLEHEKQYQVILTSLVFFRKQLVSAAGALKVPEAAVNAMFNQVDFLEAQQNAFVGRVAAIAAEKKGGSVAAGLGEYVRGAAGAAGKLYVPYIEQLSQVLEDFERLKVKSKTLCAKLKEFERECALTGMTSFQFSTMISAPARHLHGLHSDLKEVLANTSPTADAAGWAALHEACEKLARVLQRVDEAKKYSDRIKKLIKLKELLPDVEDLVDGTRDLVYDCDVTVAAVSLDDYYYYCNSSSNGSGGSGGAGGAGSGSGGDDDVTIPAHPTSDDVNGSSSKNPLNALKAGQSYGLYLFSDVAFFVYKKHVVARINIKDMAATPVGKEKGGKYAITVQVAKNISLNGGGGGSGDSSSGSGSGGKANTFKMVVGSEGAYKQLSFNLQEAIIKRSKTQILGVGLETIMARPPERGKAVPKIIEAIAAYIKENCATDDAEGVFRLSGSSSAVASYIARINAGMRVRFTDVIAAGAIFKAILRAMPSPLLTAELYDRWMELREDAAGMRSECLPKLPQYNRLLLYMIVDLCREVSKHADLNKMTAENLSIVFAPNILYKTKNSNDPAAINQSCIAVTTLITNADTIFAGVDAELQALKKSATDAKIKASSTKLERNIKRATLRRSALVDEDFDYDDEQAAADAAAAAAAAAAGGGAAPPQRVPSASPTPAGVVPTLVPPGVGRKTTRPTSGMKTLPVGKARPGSGFIGVRAKTLPKKPADGNSPADDAK